MHLRASFGATSRVSIWTLEAVYTYRVTYFPSSQSAVTVYAKFSATKALAPSLTATSH
jgi:hypothetical protein